MDHAPGAQDAVHRAAHRRGGHGKPDPLPAAGARENRLVDADKFAAHVDERSAAVARIDRRVDLEQIARILAALPVFRADNPLGHALLQAVRIAHRHHRFADFDRLGIAEGQRHHVPVVDLEDGDVRGGVSADQSRRAAAAITEFHLDLIHAFDHMVVRDDMPFLANDGSRTELILGAGIFLTLVAMEKLVERVVLVLGQLHGARGGDAHYRRHDGPGQRDPLAAHGRQNIHVFQVDARAISKGVFLGVAGGERTTVEHVLQGLRQAAPRPLAPLFPELERADRDAEQRHEEQEMEEAFHGRKMIRRRRPGGRVFNSLARG